MTYSFLVLALNLNYRINNTKETPTETNPNFNTPYALVVYYIRLGLMIL